MRQQKIQYAILTLTIIAVIAACNKTADKSDELFDSTATKAANGPINVAAADNSYSVMLPARWLKLYRVDSLSTAERGMARPGVLNFVYLPRDTTQLPQTLIVVAVYDSIAWQKVKAEGGPPPGDSVASGNGRVYVLSPPQSNPFAPGSADAVKFDSLALTAGEKSSLLKLNPAALKN